MWNEGAVIRYILGRHCLWAQQCISARGVTLKVKKKTSTSTSLSDFLKRLLNLMKSWIFWRTGYRFYWCRATLRKSPKHSLWILHTEPFPIYLLGRRVGKPLTNIYKDLKQGNAEKMFNHWNPKFNNTHSNMVIQSM